MSRLAEIRASFLAGRISKADYILQMHEMHSRLYEYAEFLKDTSVGKISISPGEVRMSFWDTGLEFVVDPIDRRPPPLEALNFGAYEETELRMMCKLIGADYSVIDIGANLGWYALALGKKFPSAKVHAFEPIPRTFNLLKKHIEINHVSNVAAYPFGFSEKEDNLPFYYFPEEPVNASLADVSGRSSEKIICHVKRFDEFASREKLRVDFIKCDVEGAELLVFMGALKTIAGQKPVIFSEMLRKWSSKFNYHPNEIIALLASVGYQCFVTSEGRLRRFERMDESTVETNFFFLHTEKHAKKIADHS